MPQAILIPVGTAAVVVTALSDIPEVVPWGHELGIGVSSVAWAYVGAYIFNWLIVERPRQQALRGYYAAAEVVLKTFQSTYSLFLYFIYAWAGEHFEWSGDGPTQVEIFRVVRKTDWRSPKGITDPPREMLQRFIDQHHEAYAALVPLLPFFEPQVSVAITSLNACMLVRMIETSPADMSGLNDKQAADFFAQYMAEYCERSLTLGRLLSESKFCPIGADL